MLKMSRKRMRGADWFGVTMPRNSLALVLWLMLVLAPPVYAGEGVFEINQACALNTGCFSGDSAGFPVTISDSGSYRLTGKLSGATGDGISIEASQVTIDLMGFSLCSGTGSGLIASTPMADIVVMNGTVCDWGGVGIDLGTSASSRVINVLATGNGSAGIRVGTDSSVFDSIARGNSSVGIQSGSGSVIRDNVANANGDGIVASFHSIVRGNSATNNGFNGIFANMASIVAQNSAYNNGNDQISTQSNCQVTGNAVRSFAGQGFGMRLGIGTGYTGNTVTTQAGAAGTISSGVNQGGNACNGNTICP
jgi:hypothetical protein